MRSVSGALTQNQTFVSWFKRRAGLLERLQHRVALEALCKRGSSFGTKLVVPDTARMGLEMGTELCEGADRKATLLGRAAHLSSLSTPFPLIQLAMGVAEATRSPLLDRSIFSVGFVPLSLSI